ncbi:MAG: energy-coupled thiamine transporter ThiT [Oscillospiraceae bacterium]|nr:energy-coupled thiamine transporter ThiT [Oscillospiraceae bacterium]
MKKQKLKIIAEGAILTALALVLSYIKIPIGLGFGGFCGSVDLVMIPLIVYAVRRGCLPGLAAGLVFGTLKFFLAGGVAVNWQSMLLDYSLAYMFVGFAGVIPQMRGRLPLAAFVGCAARFVIHYISGVTIYAQYMPEEFMNMTMISPAIYSLLYNGTYMLPNTILAAIICALLKKPLEKIKL